MSQILNFPYVDLSQSIKLEFTEASFENGFTDRKNVDSGEYFLKSLAGNMKGSVGFYSLLFCEEMEQWLEGME